MQDGDEMYMANSIELVANKIIRRARWEYIILISFCADMQKIQNV